MANNGWPFGRALLVDPLKATPGQVDLAAHFQPFWRAFLEGEGHAANGLDIGSDVLTPRPVATRGGSHQLSVLVGQRHGQPIHFGLCDKREILATQQTGDALVPGSQFVLGELVAEAEHGDRMDDYFEGLERRRPHLLRWRIRRLVLGMRFFQIPQLAQHAVVLRIRNLRVVQHVVAVVVIFELPPKLLDVLLDVPEIRITHD